MTKPTFDMEAALQALRDGRSLNGKDGILTPLIKQRIQGGRIVDFMLCYALRANANLQIQGVGRFKGSE